MNGWKKIYKTEENAVAAITKFIEKLPMFPNENSDDFWYMIVPTVDDRYAPVVILKEAQLHYMIDIAHKGLK